nr:beta-galactosidase trimerization domain-containing protein [Candidatus Njordarchaeum guaymaensis]
MLETPNDAVESRDMENWYEKPIRVFDMALEDDCGGWVDRWTAKGLVELVRAANANVVNMMIVNEWGQAYFEAKLLPKHPQLRETDRLKEVLQEAHKCGIRVTGMWGPSPNPLMYERHPDWAARSETGEISGWGFMNRDPCVHLCHNSPYGEIILKTLEDLFGNYDIDGVVYDYFIGRRGCYCKYCREEFLNDTGLDLATRGDWTKNEYDKLSDWWEKDAAEFVNRSRDVASKYGRVLIRDVHADVVFEEPHTGGLITIKDKGFEIQHTMAKARARKKPVVICTPYAHLFYVGIPKPPEHMRQEFREIVIQGASPWPVIWDWEILKDKRGIAPLRTVFTEVEKNAEYLEDAQPAEYAALLFSDQSISRTSGKPYLHVDAVKGFYDALTRAHVPVNLILDSDVSSSGLSQYKVLILASASCLSDSQIEAVENFVRDGGGLVASYLTSLYFEKGYHRSGFALGNVFGCEYQSIIDDPWTWIKLLGDHPITEGFEPGFALLHGEMDSLQGRLDPDCQSLNEAELKLRGITVDASYQAKVKIDGDAKVLATILDSAKPLGSYFKKDLSPAIPGKDTGYPAIITNTYGKGKVVYFAGQIDRLFYRIGHPDHDRLLLNSVLWAGGDPVLKVDAPNTVEATFFEQPGRKIIHLLNHTYDQLFPAPTTGVYGNFSRGVARAV